MRRGKIAPVFLDKELSCKFESVERLEIVGCAFGARFTFSVPGVVYNSRNNAMIM